MRRITPLPRVTVLAAAIAAGFGALGATTRAGAQSQPGRTVWDGVYSEAQAARGLGIYREHCVSCHMESLDGGNVAAALVGSDFMEDWKGKSVGDLFKRTSATMPGDDPGNLTPQQVSDSLAYIFSKNKFPVGSDELPTTADALKLIRIQPQK